MKHAEDFLKNFREEKGWRQTLSVLFRDFSWARRILGGKWELWVHDKGKIEACLSWHWVNEWSDKFTEDTDYLVAKRFYVKGRSVPSLEYFVNYRIDGEK